MNEVYKPKIEQNKEKWTRKYELLSPVLQNLHKKGEFTEDRHTGRQMDIQTVITAEKARRNNLANAHILFYEYKYESLENKNQ